MKECMCVFLINLNLVFFVVCFFNYLHNFVGLKMVLLSLMALLYKLYVLAETFLKYKVLGFFSKNNTRVFYWSFCLFIWTEVLLFFGFFWGLGKSWNEDFFSKNHVYKHNIAHMGGLSMPFLGSVLLFMSAISLSYSLFDYKKMGEFNVYWVMVTVLLGVSFICCQILEYGSIWFSHNWGMFSSLFYGMTFLHGFHVFVGVLMFCYLIMVFYIKNFSINSTNSMVFFAISLYWHFVDVVWIFVYSLEYLILPL